MNKIILLIFIVIPNFLTAQIKPADIYNNWVVSKVTYSNDAELPDDNILKYSYSKYTFSRPNKMGFSALYYESGGGNLFEIVGNELVVKSAQGSIMNTMQIVELTPGRLMLQQQGPQGYDDPTALKYSFITEAELQNAIPLTFNDAYCVSGSDTVYKQSPKLYATFKNQSFHRYLTENLEGKRRDNKAAHLQASFIVSKEGVADSLKIIEGIDPDYDKAYIKAFNKKKNNWNAAKLNGKTVSVRMTQEMRYFTSDMAIPSYTYTRDGNNAYSQQNYELALYYYDKALNKLPFDKENLYKRGICKLRLGNQSGACEDWRKLKELGGTTADVLLAKYCK